MERDVTGWLHKGETVPNLVAGLAYSIALNYLNRVVRGRKIGKVIYFQGGTAYNDAVTAAFASLLGQEDHGAAVQRRDGRHRHGADRAAVAPGDAGATPVPRLRPARSVELPTRDFVCKACSQLLRHEGDSPSRARRATGATSAPTSSASLAAPAASR